MAGGIDLLYVFVKEVMAKINPSLFLYALNVVFLLFLELCDVMV